MRKEFLKNIYCVLIFRMLLVYGMYTLTRLIFYLFNLDLFPEVTAGELFRILLGGLRFDTSAIIYTNLLVILLHILPFKFRYANWYQQVIKYVFYIFNIIAIAGNFVDTIYYRFTLRRTTTSVFTEFENEKNGFGLFFRFIIDYWYVTISFLAACFLLVYVYRKIKVGRPLIKNPYVYYPVNVAVGALIGLLCVAGMRGGFAHSTRPITLSNASEYVDKPGHREIVLNTPFTIIRTIGKVTLQKKNYFTPEEIGTIFSPVQTPAADSASLRGMLAGRNVVVFILESFGREHIGALNKDIPDYSGYTPFLDSLCKTGYAFKYSFANGRKSIEALPSALASVPGLETPFILSHYSGDEINSLASLLAGQGYHSAFFHGAPNGSMGFNAFVKQAGFQEYYGKDEYNNDVDFDGIWGIWDEPFLLYMADVMNGFKQPFVSSVFTLSSHHPYKVPVQYEGKFPKGPLPIQECIGYTDNALKNFFAKAAAMPWFNNTLFVLMADHSTGGYLPEYKTGVGSYAIPMVLYAPGSDLKGFNDSTVVQQCDVLPTVMNLLGYDKEFISFGRNMFDNSESHFAVGYLNGAFQIIQDEFVLQFENEKTIGLYNYRTDKLMQDNLVGKLPEVQQDMENKLKAFIQEYNDRLIDNRLSIH